MKSFNTMLKTELKLSLRGMDMVIFAICMPIVVLVAIGVIYGNKPAFEGANYTFLDQSFGAITSIAICAGGVMGLPLVVSDYRSKHILKRFKVTPVDPIVILLVEVTIYALYSLVSMSSLFLVAKLFFKILKSAILGQSVENIIIPIVIMLIITAICSAVAIKCFKWE